MQKYEVITGNSRLVGKHVVELPEEKIQAGAILICTDSGYRTSSSRVKKDILTTDNIFEQDDLPKRSAIIIGTGNVGTEMEQALSRLGCSVSLFGRSSKIAGITDPEINCQAEKLLTRELYLHLSTFIERVEKSDGGVFIQYNDGQVRPLQNLEHFTRSRRRNYRDRER